MIIPVRGLMLPTSQDPLDVYNCNRFCNVDFPQAGLPRLMLFFVVSPHRKLSFQTVPELSTSLFLGVTDCAEELM